MRRTITITFTTTEDAYGSAEEFDYVARLALLEETQEMIEAGLGVISEVAITDITIDGVSAYAE